MEFIPGLRHCSWMDDSEDRRHHARFRRLLKAAVRALALHGAPGASSISVRGKLTNIGQGGVGFVANRELPVSALVECRIFLPPVPVPIPTLLSVRWSSKRLSGGQHETRPAIPGLTVSSPDHQVSYRVVNSGIWRAHGDTHAADTPLFFCSYLLMI